MNRLIDFSVFVALQMLLLISLMQNKSIYFLKKNLTDPTLLNRSVGIFRFILFSFY